MNVECKCNGKYNKETFLKDSVENTCCDEYVFLKGGISFLISDGLEVKVASPSSLAQMLSNVGLSDMNQIEEMHVEIGKNEVIHLLVCSLISKTPLSDVFLPKQKQKRARVDTITMSEFGSSISENGTRNNTKKLELKLTVRKSTNMVLCAESGNDFVDSLFNFLTIPLGSIEDVLKGNSGLGCIDNLYKSVENLDSKWFNTPPPNMNIQRHEENLKMILLKPGIAPNHKSKNLLLQIKEGFEPYFHDPRQSVGSNRSEFEKFAKEPSLFYVMDNLEVRPLSSTMSSHRTLQNHAANSKKSIQSSEKYYQCSECSKKSYFTNVECSCDGTFNKETVLKDLVEITCCDEYVFLKGGMSFLISDDLQVKCASPSSLVQMISNVGLNDMNRIKEMNVEVGKNEVICLLARSFISKTPLSDVFLPKQKQKRARVDTKMMSEFGNLLSENGTSNNTKKLELKLTVRKSTNKVLCAEAGNDFVDFLFSILTIPIGSIEDALKGSSGLGCIDNFYKSVEALDSKWFNMRPKQNIYWNKEIPSVNLKTILLNPGVAPYHNSEYQLLQISEGKSEIYNLHDIRQFVRGAFVAKCQRFAKEPFLFYVMDNLEVRSLSSTSTICLLQELNVPLNDIEEQMISIGESEALNLLKASLTSSSSALTEGLNHRLKKQTDEDVQCNVKKLCRAG